MALKLPGNSWSIAKVKVRLGGWRENHWLWASLLEDLYGTEHQIGTTGVRFHQTFPSSHYLYMLIIQEYPGRLLVELDLDAVPLSTTARRFWINRSQVL